MNKISVVVITKNEQETLPKLLDSIKNIDDIVILDTGSTDNTVKIAKERGCSVTEVGDKYLHIIDKELADKINKQFIVDDEALIVNEKDKYFDFASARNHAASLAKNDMVSFADADEAFTKFDTEKIQKLIKNGSEQFEYNFVFAHDQHRRESIKFVQSKFYDRRKMKWVGLVHECLQGSAKRTFLDEDVFKLEHFQNHSTGRHSYLVGLAVDCFNNPNKDRNSHYFARELLWSDRPKSAIKEFKRHVEMNRWPAEKAQSMIFLGDAYGKINQPEKQVEWYNKSLYIDNKRREAFIKLARFYQHNNNPQAAACYASAAMEVPWSGFYATDMADYTNVPHEILYWAKGWVGDIGGAKKHLTKALDHCPFKPEYLRDTKFYFEYPDQGIEGWMQFSELTWLYETAKKMDSILEVGSWQGRSTHALLSGCKGKVTAVDTFAGSKDLKDWTHDLAKQKDIYGEFMKNVGHFKNLEVMKMSSKEAAKKLEGKKYDMVFIDAGHTKEEVLEDIAMWKDKARVIMSGHDYISTIWMGVKEAVDESMGAVKVGGYSIWHQDVQAPFVSIIIPTLGRSGKLNNLLKLIKENAGYDNYEIIVKYDQFPPNNTGVPKLLKQGVEESHGDLVMYLGNDCVPKKDFLQLAVYRMIKNFPDLDGMVGLNDGYWNGEFATHFLVSKKLLPGLGNEFFHTGYFHTGADNELTERCKKIGKYVWAEEAKVYHDHPIQDGYKTPLDDVYQLAYRKDRADHDRALYKKRAKELGFEFKENFVVPDIIPKRIFTIWLGDEMPELVKKCIESQKIEGYEHKLITLDNCFKDSKYMKECLASKHDKQKWCKASDYLRMHYLYTEGGIYLDADVEVLEGKNFDDLLKNKMFAGREENGWIGSAVVASEPGHKFVKRWMNEVEINFRGDDDKCFESSMEILTKGYDKWEPEGFKIYTPDYFFPYNHEKETVKITKNTITKHHFMKTWKE